MWENRSSDSSVRANWRALVAWLNLRAQFKLTTNFGSSSLFLTNCVSISDEHEHKRQKLDHTHIQLFINQNFGANSYQFCTFCPARKLSQVSAAAAFNWIRDWRISQIELVLVEDEDEQLQLALLLPIRSPWSMEVKFIYPVCDQTRLIWTEWTIHSVDEWIHLLRVNLAETMPADHTLCVPQMGQCNGMADGKSLRRRWWIRWGANVDKFGSNKLTKLQRPNTKWSITYKLNIKLSMRSIRK